MTLMKKDGSLKVNNHSRDDLKRELVYMFGVRFHKLLFLASVHGSMHETSNFLLYNNLLIYQVLCTLIYRRRSLNSFFLNASKEIAWKHCEYNLTQTLIMLFKNGGAPYISNFVWKIHGYYMLFCMLFYMPVHYHPLPCNVPQNKRTPRWNSNQWSYSVTGWIIAGYGWWCRMKQLWITMDKHQSYQWLLKQKFWYISCDKRHPSFYADP